MVFVQIRCRGVKEQRRYDDERKGCTRSFSSFDGVAALVGDAANGVIK
jgi:hypothetical protein